MVPSGPNPALPHGRHALISSISGFNLVFLIDLFISLGEISTPQPTVCGGNCFCFQQVFVYEMMNDKKMHRNAMIFVA